MILEIIVARPAPAAPMAGEPRLPYMNIQFRITFSTFAAMSITIGAFVLPMPSRNCLSGAKSMNGIIDHIRYL